MHGFGEDARVDIHKPKPWYGFREFLKEYLIIVVGVLTALAGEQLVETLHWRHVVHDQREALNGNIQANDAAMRARLQIEPCVQRRLVELDEVFRRHRAGRPLDIVGPISRPGYILGSTRAWDLAVADGSLAHMSLKDKQNYAIAFGSWGSYYASHSDERSSWIALQGLDHADELSPQDWSEMRRILEQARDADRSMQIGLIDGGWLRHMQTLNLRPLPIPDHNLKTATVVAFCKPMLAS
jgi:hypothetical protein